LPPKSEPPTENSQLTLLPSNRRPCYGSFFFHRFGQTGLDGSFSESMWSEIETLRRQIGGYDEAPESPQTRPDARQRAREASARGMRRLYAQRRAQGLNAHGKPLKVPNRANYRYLLNKWEKILAMRVQVD